MASRTKRRRVWVVSDAGSDDCSALNVFEREADAREAVDAGYGADVQGRVLHGPGDVPARRVRWSGSSSIGPDGSVPATPSVFPTNVWDEGMVSRRTRPSVIVTDDAAGVGWTVVQVSGWGEAAALKALTGRVAKIRAERIEPAEVTS